MKSFHDYSQVVDPVDVFWVIDPIERRTKDPAYIVYDKPDKWDVEVHSHKQIDYKFTAVDNNIPLFNESTKKDIKRCDVIINTSKTICLIEIKTGRNEDISDAIEQIEATIARFNREIYSYRFRRAYVCNNRRPRFAMSHAALQNSFYKKHATKLEIHCCVIDNLA